MTLHGHTPKQRKRIKVAAKKVVKEAKKRKRQ